MDELVSVMEEIRDLLSKANEKLDDIKGHRSFRSLADVYEKLDEMSEASITLTDISLKLETLDKLYDKLDEIQGDGLYNSISDVYVKLNEIQGDGLYNSISDVADKLDRLMRSK